MSRWKRSTIAALLGLMPLAAQADGVFSNGGFAVAPYLSMPSATDGTMGASFQNFVGCLICNNNGQIIFDTERSFIDDNGVPWDAVVATIEGPEGRFGTFIDPIQEDGNVHTVVVQWYTADAYRPGGLPPTQWMIWTVDGIIVTNHEYVGGGGAIHPNMQDSSGWLYAYGNGNVFGAALNMGYRLIQAHQNDLQLSGTLISGELSLYPDAFTNIGLVEIVGFDCYPGC